ELPARQPRGVVIGLDPPFGHLTGERIQMIQRDIDRADANAVEGRFEVGSPETPPADSGIHRIGDAEPESERIGERARCGHRPTMPPRSPPPPELSTASGSRRLQVAMDAVAGGRWSLQVAMDAAESLGERHPLRPGRKGDGGPCRRDGGRGYSERRRNCAMPPSTSMNVPVVDPEAGETRYSTAPATSSGETRRPWGWRACRAARSAAGSAAESSRRPTHGVSAVPGITALTRMPSRRWSAAIARVRADTAPLDAEYSARCGRPVVEAMDAVLQTAADGDSRNHGSAAEVTRAMPVTLTESTRAHSSSSFAVMSPCAPMPALLMRMSMRPNRSPTAATAAS